MKILFSVIALVMSLNTYAYDSWGDYFSNNFKFELTLQDGKNQLKFDDVGANAFADVRLFSRYENNNGTVALLPIYGSKKSGLANILYAGEEGAGVSLGAIAVGVLVVAAVAGGGGGGGSTPAADDGSSPPADDGSSTPDDGGSAPTPDTPRPPPIGPGTPGVGDPNI